MLTRRLAKAKHLIRTEGPVAVLREISKSLWLRFRLKAAARKKTTDLDGCAFTLDTVPDSLTKLFLLDGTYELPERRAIKKHLRRDLPVIELGGALGVVACVTNKLLAQAGAHVVVEANPLAVPALTANKELNQCGFEIVNRAIAYGVDTVTFSPTVDIASNSIESSGAALHGTEKPVTVKTTRLQDITAQRGFANFSLVCDIEGKEYDLVCNELDVLKRADVIVMETHARLIGEEKNNDLISKLEGVGFRIIDEDGFVITLRRSA
jgi:FkbM family methyltransferase